MRTARVLSVDQTADVRLRDRVEAWFVDQGVPSFVERYCPDHARALIAGMLLIVLAFEFTARPELHLPVAPAVAAPGVILLCVLPALPLLDGLVDTPFRRTRPSWLRGVFVVPAVALEVGLLIRAGFMPTITDPLWPTFGIAAMTALTAYSLVQEQAWSRAGRRQLILGYLLVVGLVAANLGFAVYRLGDPVDQLVSGAELSYPTRLLSALVVSVLVVGVAGFLRRGPTPLRPAPLERFVVLRRGTAWLVLLFGLQTVILSVLPLGGAVSLVLVCLVIIAVLSSGSAQEALRWWVATVCRGKSPQLEPVRQAARHSAIPVRKGLRAHWALATVGGLLVMAYPLDVWSDTSPMMAARAAAVNAVYFCLVLTVVNLGVHRVVVWAARESVRGSLRSIAALVQGIPLLLVFVVFFSITHDMWEFAHSISSAHLFVVAGSLVILTMVFLLVHSAMGASENCHFGSWRDLERAATRGEVKEPAVLGEVVALARRAPSTGRSLRLRLTLLQRLNAAAVMVVYQLLFLLPIGLGSAAIYLVLGHATIGTALVNDWQLNGAHAKPITHAAFFDPLWVKVSVFLAAFSVLYLAVTVTMSKDQREIFLDAPRQALRQRFAIRLAYERAYRLGASALQPARARPGSARSIRTTRGTTRDAVLAALVPGQAMTAGEVAQNTGLGRKTVGTTLWRLKQAGDVTKAQRGYLLAAPSSHS